VNPVSFSLFFQTLALDSIICSEECLKTSVLQLNVAEPDTDRAWCVRVINKLN